MLSHKNVYKYILPTILICSTLQAFTLKKDTKPPPKEDANTSPGLSPKDAYLTVGGGAMFPIQRKSESTHDSSSVLFTPTQLVTSVFTLRNVEWKSRYKVGYELNGILGCNVIPELRAEVEFIYQQFMRKITGTYDWQEVDAETTTLFDATFNNPVHKASTQVRLYNLLTDLVYEIKTPSPLAILLGGGFGVSWVQSKSTTRDNILIIHTLLPPLSESSPTLEKSPRLTGTAFAWQFKLGLSYAVRSYCSVALSYRLLGTTKFWTSESSITSNPGTSSAAVFTVPREPISGFLNNSLNLSVQFRF